MALELLNKVIDDFKDLLHNLSDKDKMRPTVRKQGSFDTSKYHILRRDSMFIMDLFDQAVERSKTCHFLKVSMFLPQFDQKDEEVWDLTDIVNPSVCHAISMHYACNVIAKNLDPHIFSSRYGLQGLVGERGALYTTLGIHEATNHYL